MSTTPALFYGCCAPVIPMTYTTTPTYVYGGYAPATNLVCSGCPYPCCNLHQLQSHQPRPPSHLISVSSYSYQTQPSILGFRNPSFNLQLVSGSPPATSDLYHYQHQQQPSSRPLLPQQQHHWSPPSHGDHLLPPASSFAPPPPPQQQWGPQLHGDHLPPPPSAFAPPSHHYYHTQSYHPQQLNQDWGSQSRQAATWDLDVGKEISQEEDHHFEPARQLFDEKPDRKTEAEFQVDEQATHVAVAATQALVRGEQKSPKQLQPRKSKAWKKPRKKPEELAKKVKALIQEKKGHEGGGLVSEDGNGDVAEGGKMENGVSNGNHVVVNKETNVVGTANGKENTSSNLGAFDVNKLKSRSKVGKKTEKTATLDGKGSKAETKKITKKNRVWDDSPKEAIESKLDFTGDAGENADNNYVALAADHGESMMDKDEDYSSESEAEEEEEVGKGSKPDSKKKGWFSSMFQSIAGKSNLERSDLEPALKALKDRLMTKNVAEEIAEKLCESMVASLEGKKLGSFTRVSSTVQAAMEEALVRILTPRPSIDILRDVHAAREQRKPYVVVFFGVNGVGKSTKLAKVAYWLQQHQVSVMMVACDPFRSGAVEQLRTHARRLQIPIFDKGYEKDPAVVAKEAIQEAKINGSDVVLVDTAGRMQDNEPLMRALSKLIYINNPDLVLFCWNARACLRLQAACEKLKKVLSANPEAPLNIECLMEEKDVRGFIRRDELEHISALYKCNMAGKPVVVTRVVDSMTDNLRPTRAEATDVANAVLDGIDAILLGDETLRGLYPIDTISTVGKICAEAEKVFNQDLYFKRTVKYVGEPMKHLESIVSSAVRATIKVKASVIICFTFSGRAARLIAKYRPTMPVLSLVIPRLKTNQLKWNFTGAFEARQSLLVRGLYPMLADPHHPAEFDFYLCFVIGCVSSLDDPDQFFTKITINLLQNGVCDVVLNLLGNSVAGDIVCMGDNEYTRLVDEGSYSEVTKMPRANMIPRLGFIY